MVEVIKSTSQLQADGIWSYRKSIGAGLAAFVGLLADAWADGSITTAEWKTIAIGTIAAAFTAYALPNKVKPTPPAPVDPPPAP